MKEKKVGEKKRQKKGERGKEGGRKNEREGRRRRKKEGGKKEVKKSYFSKGIRTNVNVLLIFFLTRLYPKAFI